MGVAGFPHLPGARPWLYLLDDEIEPTVLESQKPVSVLWSSLWPSRPHDQVLLSLTAVGGGETLLRFTLQTPDDPPDPSKTGHLRRGSTSCSSRIFATPTGSDTQGAMSGHAGRVCSVRR